MTYREFISGSVDLTSRIDLTTAAGSGRVILWPGKRAGKHSVDVCFRHALQLAERGLALAVSGDNVGVSGSSQFVSMSAVTPDPTGPFLICAHLFDISASAKRDMRIEGGFMASYEQSLVRVMEFPGTVMMRESSAVINTGAIRDDLEDARGRIQGRNLS